MAFKAKVIVKDLGWGNITRSLAQADNSYTKVGFPQDARPGKPNKKKIKGHDIATNMTEIATIAAFNEWGTKSTTSSRSGGINIGSGSIPPRPFMSTSFDENKSDLQIVKKKLYQAIIDGKINTPEALKIIGEWMTNKVKAKIRSLRTPPNAPYTIRKKKSSNPLIDLGQMINSVTHTETIKIGGGILSDIRSKSTVEG